MAMIGGASGDDATVTLAIDSMSHPRDERLTTEPESLLEDLLNRGWTAMNQLARRQHYNAAEISDP